MIKSPMNYTGGKYKLLPQILPLFPKENEYTTFVDLFCGGCNVAVNIKNKKVIANDYSTQLIDIYEYFQEAGKEQVYKDIYETIDKYKLSKTNKEGYLALRSEYNKTKEIKLLYVLICFSFNNQIRFNSKGDFNMPFGTDRSSFNSALEERLGLFIDGVRDIQFVNENFCHAHIPDDSFVYMDPPYLISTATYNEQGGWTEEHEHLLLESLDSFNERNIKFALSNVLVHKGQENTILKEWSKKYNVHFLNKRYDNCSYQVKEKYQNETQEVLITNY